MHRFLPIAEKNDSLAKGMGTTVILAVVRGSIIHIAYAGDSRVYLIDENGDAAADPRSQYGSDDGAPGAKISAEEARSSSRKSIILPARLAWEGCCDVD